MAIKNFKKPKTCYAFRCIDGKYRIESQVFKSYSQDGFWTENNGKSADSSKWYGTSVWFRTLAECINHNKARIQKEIDLHASILAKDQADMDALLELERSNLCPE